jgi:integrase
MRGCIKKRGNKYVAIVTVGTKINKAGKTIPEQKWITCSSNKEAEAKLAELINQVNKGEYIPNSKITVKEWLTTWLNDYVMNSSKKKLRTKDSYRNVVQKHLIPELGQYQLQKLTPSHIQKYYNSSPLSDKTKSIHQAILYQALKVAMIQENLIKKNPAELVAEKPNGKKITQEMQTWNQEEIRKFLKVAKQKSLQTEVFYTLALETGMRKGELCGLIWGDINFEAGMVSVIRTLLKSGINPILGTPKNGKSRTIKLSKTTVELLKKLKVKQSEIKLCQGTKLDDQNYIFTKQNGKPLQINNLAENEFNKLITQAGVKKIRIHDLRHTAATLMIENGVPIKEVSERLGHSDVGITLNRYSHVTPAMQEKAALVMDQILGRY